MKTAKENRSGIDALRGLDSIPGCDVNVHIRRAEMQDLEQVMELHEALWQYAKGAPIFLLSEKRDRSYYEEWFSVLRHIDDRVTQA